MKEKSYIWIIEVKTSTSKIYKPFFGTFADTHYGPAYQNRQFARIAAKYMQDNNQYNYFGLMVKYRVAKYKKI